MIAFAVGFLFGVACLPLLVVLIAMCLVERDDDA